MANNARVMQVASNTHRQMLCRRDTNNCKYYCTLIVRVLVACGRGYRRHCIAYSSVGSGVAARECLLIAAMHTCSRDDTRDRHASAQGQLRALHPLRFCFLSGAATPRAIAPLPAGCTQHRLVCSRAARVCRLAPRRVSLRLRLSSLTFHHLTSSMRYCT